VRGRRDEGWRGEGWDGWRGEIRWPGYCHNKEGCLSLVSGNLDGFNGSLVTVFSLCPPQEGHMTCVVKHHNMSHDLYNEAGNMTCLAILTRI